MIPLGLQTGLTILTGNEGFKLANWKLIFRLPKQRWVCSGGH